MKLPLHKPHLLKSSRWVQDLSIDVEYTLHLICMLVYMFTHSFSENNY